MAFPPAVTPRRHAEVTSLLRPHERRLFAAASPADQAHGVAVADRVADAVGDDARWQRAALLHDAGKTRAGLGAVGRVAVTTVAAVAPVTAARWEAAAGTAGRVLDRVGWLRRPGAYLAHGPFAGEWLARHGTEEEVTAWVTFHHRPDLWPELPIPAPIVRALSEADV